MEENVFLFIVYWNQKKNTTCGKMRIKKHLYFLEKKNLSPNSCFCCRRLTIKFHKTHINSENILHISCFYEMIRWIHYTLHTHTHRIDYYLLLSQRKKNQFSVRSLYRSTPLQNSSILFGLAIFCSVVFFLVVQLKLQLKMEFDFSLV